MPLTPRPSGLVGGSATGLLALSGALAAQAQLAAATKEDRAGVEAEGSRGKWMGQGSIGQVVVVVVVGRTGRPPCPEHQTHIHVRGLQGPFTSN